MRTFAAVTDSRAGFRRDHSPPGVCRALAAGLALVAGLGLAACDDPGSGDVLAIEAVGAVDAALVFDANGTGSLDGGDDPLSDWTLNLDQPAGGTVASATTDEDGIARFQEVPVGRLVPSVPAGELGDTLDFVTASVEPFTLAAQQSAQLAVALTLPSRLLEEVRTTPSGVPLFVEGVALNPFAPGDRSLHLRAGSHYLRVLSVEEGAVAFGDSVRVRGRTATDQGVAVLDGQAVFRLGGASEVPTPIALSTGEAAGAQGGSLDAALVRIRDADILDVTDEGDDGIVLNIDDGSGVLALRFREFLGADPDLIDPETDRISVCVGLLVPTRTGQTVAWEIRPRAQSDVAIVRDGE